MPSATPSTAPRLERDLVDEVAIEWWVRAAHRIRKRRTRLGMTQADLAHQCGITPQAVGQIERGVTHPSEPVRWLLADALACEVDDIWEPMSRDELHRRCASLESAA